MVVFGAGAPCEVGGFGGPPRCAASGAAVINKEIATRMVLFMGSAIARGIPLRLSRASD